jgi:hypothetical protein
MDDENDYLGMTLEAAVDYPELADIIAANPPPIEVTASRRKVASSWQVVDDGGNVLATYDSIEKATKAAGDKYHVMLQSNHTITDGAADPAVVEGMPPVTSPVGIRRQAEGFMDWMSDRVLDAAENRGITPDVFTGPSHDWCRFRANSHCHFPSSLNVEATQVAGYPVWFVADRGFCPRQKWEAQQACPVGEPGPNAHGGGGIECTRNWNEGGQRDGRPMPMVSLDFGDPDKAFRDAGVQVYQRDQVM